MGGSSLLWGSLCGNDKWQLLLQTQGPRKSDQTRLGVNGTGMEGSTVPSATNPMICPLSCPTLSASDHMASPLLLQTPSSGFWVPFLTAPPPLAPPPWALPETHRSCWPPAGGLGTLRTGRVHSGSLDPELRGTPSPGSIAGFGVWTCGRQLTLLAPPRDAAERPGPRGFGSGSALGRKPGGLVPSGLRPFISMGGHRWRVCTVNWGGAVSRAALRAGPGHFPWGQPAWCPRSPHTSRSPMW